MNLLAGVYAVVCIEVIQLTLALPSSLDTAKEAEVCPRKAHLTVRKCKKACSTDSDCKGRKKRCVCDDVCGLTCLNPKGKCPPPRIVNGKAKITGKNELGAVARYRCKRGYELRGVETRICNGDREWSGEAPVCVPAGKISADRNVRDPVQDVPLNTDSGDNSKAAWCPEPPSVAFADHDGAKQTHFPPGSQLSYSCRSGYASDGIAMARCMTSGKWAGPMMACREEVCSDPGDLVNGVVFGEPPYLAASKVNYECKKGYRLVGSPLLTCEKGGAWTFDKPRCQLASSVGSCPRIRSPRHGTRIGRTSRVDSVVTIVCDRGYTLRGTAKRICRQDGTWSGVEAECTPIDCGHPGNLWNGYIQGNDFTYGSSIKYRCFDGTKFDGLAVTAFCLESGVWSFPLPQCLRSCSKPVIAEATLFVDSSPAQPILEHGTELLVSCDDGLSPNNVKDPVCNNGTWSHLPMCVQGGCDQRPKEISNGMALYRGTKYGDRVRYACNSGHKLIGDQFLTCQGGEWKGNLPECRPVYCPHPGELRNGKILLVGDIGKFEYRANVRHAGQGEKIEYYCSTGHRVFPHGEHIEFYCSQGFWLEGPNAATCINGMWSPEQRPQCIDNQHPMLPTDHVST